MPTRTKNAEISNIVSNSEIHLHHCLCESGGFKIGKSIHRRCSVKKVFLKILKTTKGQKLQKNTCVRVRHWFSADSFTKFLRTVFPQNTSGRLLLMKKLDDQKKFSWRKYLLRSLAYLTLNYVEKKSFVTVRVGHLEARYM